MKFSLYLWLCKRLGIQPKIKFKIDESVKAPYKLESPPVQEDGIVIEHERINLDRLSFRTYESRVIEFTKHPFVLDLYGDNQ